MQYLRFKVSVYNSYIVHVTDGRHQLSHDAAGLRFAEMLLPANPLEQLSSTQQLQNQVSVKLRQTHTRAEHVSSFVSSAPAFILKKHFVQRRQTNRYEFFAEQIIRASRYRGKKKRKNEIICLSCTQTLLLHSLVQDLRNKSRTGLIWVTGL